MRFSIAFLLAAIVSGPSTGSGQAPTQPGITFKMRTQLKNHPVPEKSKPDSVAIKRRLAEQAARADDINTSGDAPPTGLRANGGGGNTGTNRVIMMNGSAVKGNHRLDVQGVIGDPELTASQWALFTDTTTTVIDDVQHMYWPRVFDIGSILAFTGQVDAQNSNIGTLTVSWDSLPDETIEGRAAKHYQMKMEYGLKQPRRLDSLKLLAVTRVTSDYWVVNLPVNFENRFAGIGRPRRLVPDSLRGEWAKMLELYKRLDKGTIVKFNAAGIIGENANSATEYTRTMEMTEIKDAPVDPGIFKVPAEFTLRPPPQRGRGGDGTH
jgi:hypothetical protein